MSGGLVVASAVEFVLEGLHPPSQFGIRRNAPGQRKILHFFFADYLAYLFDKHVNKMPLVRSADISQVLPYKIRVVLNMVADKIQE